MVPTQCGLSTVKPVHYIAIHNDKCDVAILFTVHRSLSLIPPSTHYLALSLTTPARCPCSSFKTSPTHFAIAIPIGVVPSFPLSSLLKVEVDVGCPPV